MITIYIGDVGEYLREDARKSDLNAQLITVDNANSLGHGVYFTSISDIGSLKNLGNVLLQANRIVYSPPSKWSDDVNGHSKMKAWTEEYLNVFKFRCDVKNFNPHSPYYKQDIMLHQADHRKSHETQLWIAGCSISHGYGVTEQTRYGQLLSDRLNMPASFLTRPGSSIIWAADQILRSNIQKGDIVVWGLTSWSRTSFFKDNILYHINARSIEMYNNIIDPDFLSSDHLFYQSLTSIFQVLNFCQKMNVTLIIASLLDNHICEYIGEYPNFVMLSHLWGRDRSQLFIDIGSDNQHPGIHAHQFYADQIYQKLQQLLAKD